MPLEAHSENLAEQRSYLQAFKAALVEGDCLGIIINIVYEPLAAHPDMAEDDAQIIQLVLTLLRNLLRIADPVPTAASGAHHKTRMRVCQFFNFLSVCHMTLTSYNLFLLNLFRFALLHINSYFYHDGLP